MKYLKFLFILISLVFVSCDADLDPKIQNFVSFEAKPALNVPVDSSESFDIEVAASNTTNSDRTFNIEVVRNELTIPNEIPGQVTIPANSNVGSFTVELTDNETLGFEGQEIELGFEQLPDINFGDNIVVNVTERCDDTIVDLIITTDDFPGETTWEVYDLTNDDPVLVASGGPYDAAGAEIEEQLCLATGDYGVVVYDSYGDGIVDGGYEVFVGNEQLVDGEVGGLSSQTEFTID